MLMIIVPIILFLVSDIKQIVVESEILSGIELFNIGTRLSVILILILYITI